MADNGTRFYPSNRPPPALIRLAESVRELAETSSRIAEIPPELAEQVEAERLQIEALTRELDAFALHDAMPRMGPEPVGRRPYYVSGVLMGLLHPVQPDLEVRHEDGVTRGRVRFGVVFEGPPGCVHGGYVAHFFDQILGQHNLYSQIPAMTATLSVRYRSGTPILRDLTFEVRHRREGERKVVTSSALEVDGEVVSEGEGLFVIPRHGQWANDVRSK
jgi:acyl-coenzyme A thioesterase PaaI-like protein